MSNYRADQKGAHRANYERNRKRVFATQTHCGICGNPVDMELKPPHPLSPVVDHVIPIAKGGHPSDIENLQLAHWTCNRTKSDKLYKNTVDNTPQQIGNRNLPQSTDWTQYKSK